MKCVDEVKLNRNTGKYRGAKVRAWHCGRLVRNRYMTKKTKGGIMERRERNNKKIKRVAPPSCDPPPTVRRTPRAASHAPGPAAVAAAARPKANGPVAASRVGWARDLLSRRLCLAHSSRALSRQRRRISLSSFPGQVDSLALSYAPNTPRTHVHDGCVVTRVRASVPYTTIIIIIICEKSEIRFSFGPIFFFPNSSLFTRPAAAACSVCVCVWKTAAAVAIPSGSDDDVDHDDLDHDHDPSHIHCFVPSQHTCVCHVSIRRRLRIPSVRASAYSVSIEIGIFVFEMPLFAESHLCSSGDASSNVSSSL